MKILVPLVVVIVLAAIPIAGTAAGADFVFAGVFPYVALAVFVVFAARKIWLWARSPVPFRIPTTCGQEKSLDWIKSSRFDNPHDTLGVIGRMAAEVLVFRSLLRNTRTEVVDGPKVTYGSSKWLWAAALAFHWCFLVVLVRHLRFFSEPVFAPLGVIEAFDGFLEIGVPPLLMTGAVLLGAVTYLFLRRVFIPQIRYISLPSDYFPLFLIGGVAGTGLLMRHFVRTDIVGVKQVALGLLSLDPIAPQGVHWLFYVHIFLVCCLIAYLPFSKIMHMGGVFLSPTRNLANNNRMARHVNPWDRPVHIHTYAEYEDEFREKMKAAGIPVDKM